MGWHKSNTLRCSSLQMRRHLQVIVPRNMIVAASISAWKNPRWAQQSKVGSVSFRNTGFPRILVVQNSSPSVHWLNTNRMSKAEGNAASIFFKLRLAQTHARLTMYG